MPLRGIEAPTRLCGDVQLGGVEFFNDGQWGRLCVREFRTESTWTVDALAICCSCQPELGFPFGS